MKLGRIHHRFIPDGQLRLDGVETKAGYMERRDGRIALVPVGIE